MKRRKILPSAFLAVAVLMSVTGAASATNLTSPTGTAYTSTIEAVSEGPTVLTTWIGDTECNSSTVTGKVESHGAAVTASGKISTLTFNECGEDEVVVVKPGTLQIHGNGTVTSSGAEIVVRNPFECVYTTLGSDVGTLTDSHDTGGKATLDINSVSIAQTGPNMLCPSSAIWEGSYTVSTPKALYVD